MRDSRRAELPDGACRMTNARSMGPGSERYGERAGLEWGCVGAQGGLRSPPVRIRRGYGLHEASGAAQGRARCGASGENFYHLFKALECFQFEDLSHNFFLLFSNNRIIFMYFLLVFVGTG